MMHVSYETFWHLNPRKLKPFEKAYDEQMKSEQERMNLTAWLNGLYVQNAIASVFNKKAKYPPKPFNMSGHKKTAKEEGMDFERYVQQFNAQRKMKSITH